VPPQATRSSPPAFSPQALLDQFLKGRHEALSESLLAVLRHFRDATYHTLDAQGQYFVNEFVKTFLYLFTQAEFVPKPEHLAEFVRLNSTISNLVAMSCFGTTDPFLFLLGDRPGAAGKRMALLSARNAFPFDRSSFFDADPELANLWYGAYAGAYRGGLVREEVGDRLHANFLAADDRLDARVVPLDSYFAATYVPGHCDRPVKSALNRSVQRLAAAADVCVRNVPDARRVAVISGNWSRGHSVYRILHAYLEALDGFHLTLFHLGRTREPDTRLFHEVHRLDFDRDGALDLGPLRDNTFGVAFYPDVGLTPHSVWLANLRLARVQVAALGHSVSTFGSEIDYFLSGSGVEPTDDPGRNYSERLILLPGCGAIHERPDYAPSGRVKSTTDVLINAPWNAHKVNHRLVTCLRAIVRNAGRPVRLRLYVGTSLARQNDDIPFVRDLESQLGRGRVEILRGLNYRDYMAAMEEGDFTLDPFPFGGCNTVADSLFLRRPIVCREGDAWYGRIGPRMLRMVGLPDLSAASDDDYVATTLRLIDDDAYRAEVQARLDGADLDTTIFDRSEARLFPVVLDFLTAHHDRLRADPDRSPIRFGAT
jgi:hypothetical protein